MLHGISCALNEPTTMNQQLPAIAANHRIATLCGGIIDIYHDLLPKLTDPEVLDWLTAKAVERCPEAPPRRRYARPSTTPKQPRCWPYNYPAAPTSRRSHHGIPTHEPPDLYMVRTTGGHVRASL